MNCPGTNRKEDIILLNYHIALPGLGIGREIKSEVRNNDVFDMTMGMTHIMETWKAHINPVCSTSEND